MPRGVYIQDRIIGYIDIQMLGQGVIQGPQVSIPGQEPARSWIIVPGPEVDEAVLVIGLAGEEEGVVDALLQFIWCAEGIILIPVQRFSVFIGDENDTAQAVLVVISSPFFAYLTYYPAGIDVDVLIFALYFYN